MCMRSLPPEGIDCQTQLLGPQCDCGKRLYAGWHGSMLDSETTIHHDRKELNMTSTLAKDDRAIRSVQCLVSSPRPLSSIKQS
jgi:hypothetical protein